MFFFFFSCFLLNDLVIFELFDPTGLISVMAFVEFVQTVLSQLMLLNTIMVVTVKARVLVHDITFNVKIVNFS